MITQTRLAIQTNGRGLIEITEQLNSIVRESSAKEGLAQIFLQHTSASLIISEKADPTVLADLETVLARLAPDGDPAYQHNYEGDDDMAAHVRCVLTSNDISIPVQDNQLALGTWQGVYLWEHRYRAHTRSLLVTLIT